MDELRRRNRIGFVERAKPELTQSRERQSRDCGRVARRPSCPPTNAARQLWLRPNGTVMFMAHGDLSDFPVPGQPILPPEPEPRPRCAARCLIPGFDWAIHSLEWKDALWDRYATAAPGRPS
jgi:hypothetical protein